MKKIKKILVVSIIGLLALILIATIVIGLNLDRIVKLSVETVAPTITQTPVTLDSAGISLLTGSASLKGLVVGNPPGYQTPSAISIEKAAISLSPGSLLSDKIVIRSIEIHAPEITFEGNPFGANNLAKILDNVNGTPDTNGPVRPGTNKPAKKLEVDDFLLAGATRFLQSCRSGAHQIQHHIALAQQVLHQNTARRGRVASIERIEHLPVFLHGEFPHRLVLVGAKPQRLHARIDLSISLAQQRIFGGAVDGSVNTRIETVVPGQVAACEARQHFKVQGANLSQLQIRYALRRQFSRHAFKFREDFKCMRHIAFAEPDRHGAAVRQQIDESFGGHELDRLPQRRARNGQQRAELALVELGARRNVPLHQHLAQTQCHLVVQRAPRNSYDVCHALLR